MKNHNLNLKYYATYKIIHEIGKVAYELYLNSSQIHKFFRLSFLENVFWSNYVSANKNSSIR